MPFDGIVLNAVLHELKKTLVGGRIDKIYQPDKNEIVLFVRHCREENKLLISAHPQNCRLHITEKHKENPISPPMFCMLLRKNLIGGRIREIKQRDLERLVEIEVENTDEFGRIVLRTLLVEIMGKHSNIILIDAGDGTVIDSIKRIPPEINRVRQVLPGVKYVFPPFSNRVSLLSVDNNQIMSIILDLLNRSDKTLQVYRWITENFMGVSGAASKEILFRSGIDANKPVPELTEEEKRRIAETLVKLSIDIRNLHYSPKIYVDRSNRQPCDFWVFPLHHLTSFYEVSGCGVNETVDRFYSQKEDFEALINIKKTLTLHVSKHLKKLNQSLVFQREKLAEAQDAEKFRIFGEVLSAYLYKLTPGMKEISLPNFYDENKSVVIPLDEKLSPAQNAQKYFSKYKKLRATREKVEAQMEETVREVEYLETVLYNIEAAETLEDVTEIQSELFNEGYIKEHEKKTKGEDYRSHPMKYKSSAGFVILVGKNNRQNDMLTRRAKPDDIWVHVKDAPGSHVIIQTGGRRIDDDTILEACTLAAYYSKARNGGNVPVDYTLKKYVRKPPGAKPGFVIYDHHKTVYVTPHDDLIEKLTKI
ncbi:Rqc2 family fibronectin-binding protein [Thermosediminibacter litoriperuensis]|uniref:Rqc2 homolog RqcH n=1 Tax=Thermosediminibacter litoriperuensis TaxID=291989 RepID=A0A5S5B0C0_9FIRM|nr:NFACT RNA binding domain-containing protein [Thermosediminibacter litoriperuensis]TYP60008.1 putative ribosome quality control (RQC) complex YloA/Tae2 family protein [Thermosediminibacter litoriperuensis]